MFQVASSGISVSGTMKTIMVYSNLSFSPVGQKSEKVHQNSTFFDIFLPPITFHPGWLQKFWHRIRECGGAPIDKNAFLCLFLESTWIKISKKSAFLLSYTVLCSLMPIVVLIKKNLCICIIRVFNSIVNLIEYREMGTHISRFYFK